MTKAIDSNKTGKDGNEKGKSLKIASIFCSIQGESTTQGEITSFIRLSGCNLDCSYCDTKWSHKDGTDMSLSEIISSVKKHKSKYVTVTGGEPLLQKNCFSLLQMLAEQNFETSLETNGTIDISEVHCGVRIIMDIKCPESGMERFNYLKNTESLKPDDELKFVLSSETDYEWAKEIIYRLKLADKCKILMSPIEKTMTSRQLAELILRDKLEVRLNLQLHKLIWGDDENEH